MNPILPSFNEHGLLPPDDYPFSIDQLRTSHLVTGAGNPSTAWDARWRLHLVNNLEIIVMQMWEVGLTEIFADGSFVQDIDHPSDIDCYFVCDSKRLDSVLPLLNANDSDGVWTCDRDRRIPAPPKEPQLPMFIKYGIEMWPHPAMKGDARTIFPKYFRQDRETKRPKGIVKIIR